MKTVSAPLQTHVESNVTTLATCWKVTARDGTVLAFTNHTDDIVVDGITYKSPTGYTPTNISTSAGLEVDNLDARAVLKESGLVKSELLAGKWDYATLEFFVVNYASPGDGIVKLRKGFLGEVKVGRNDVQAEIRGLMDKYTTEVVELYSASCRADLGDSRCTINLIDWTMSGVVSAVSSSRIFQASALEYRAPIFTDNFNRADGGVGSNYTVLTAYPAGALTIVSNRVRGTLLDYNEMQYNIRTMPANCYARVALSEFGGGAFSVDLGLRLGAFSGPWNGYYGIAKVSGDWEITKLTNGVSASLATGSTTWNDGDILMFECEGTTLRVYKNGSLLGSVVDSTYQTAGYGSLVIENYGSTLADIEVDNFELGAKLAAGDNLTQGGLLTWLTGLNAGGKMEVRMYTDSTKEFELVLPMPTTIQVGDTFSVFAGCDKSHTTCFSKFNNILNFRGEPFIPQNKAIGVAEGRSPDQGGGKK